MSRAARLACGYICCALAVPALMVGMATADDMSQDAARALRSAGSIRPLDELLERVRERHPGARLLDAELEHDDGRYSYEFEIVTRDGEVRELEVDAGSGEILEDEAED